MQPIITENREKIAELCRQHHVRTLSVFGSAVRDDFDPTRSDVDMIVEFANPDSVRFAPNFFSLQRSLASLLGHSVDLVIDGTLTNAIIARNAASQKEILYAA